MKWALACVFMGQRFLFVLAEGCITREGRFFFGARKRWGSEPRRFCRHEP